MFRNKSPSDELFLHFFFESSESDRVFNFLCDSNSIFFGSGALIQNGFRRARYIKMTHLTSVLHSSGAVIVYPMEGSLRKNKKACFFKYPEDPPLGSHEVYARAKCVQRMPEPPGMQAH